MGSSQLTPIIQSTLACLDLISRAPCPGTQIRTALRYLEKIASANEKEVPTMKAQAAQALTSIVQSLKKARKPEEALLIESCITGILMA